MKTIHIDSEETDLAGSTRPVCRSSIATVGVKAFTLVEALVAMAVLGIMVGALYTGMTYGISSTRMARENLRATQIMAEKMEIIRLLSWDQIVVSNTLPTTFVAYYDPKGATNGNRGGARYDGTIEVSQFPTSKNYQADMRQVTVRVDWTTGGMIHSRKVKSHITRYGIQNYVYN